MKIFLWNGKKSKNTLKSKARLFCEKINKNERKNKADILTEVQGSETREFWFHLGEFEGQAPNHPIEVYVLHRRVVLNINVILSFRNTLMRILYLFLRDYTKYN